jgi:hypothetical protein
MWDWNSQLRLGKSSALVKTHLRRLPLTETALEADFFLDATASNRGGERWIGMVVEKDFGGLLAMEDARFEPPTANDLAMLLAHAMLQPLNGGSRQRPRTVYLRDRPQWHELLPHLRQLGMAVVLTDDLPEFGEAAAAWIQHRTARRSLTTEQIHTALCRPFPERRTTCVEDDHVRY